MPCELSSNLYRNAGLIEGTLDAGSRGAMRHWARVPACGGHVTGPQEPTEPDDSLANALTATMWATTRLILEALAEGRQQISPASGPGAAFCQVFVDHIRRVNLKDQNDGQGPSPTSNGPPL